MLEWKKYDLDGERFYLGRALELELTPDTVTFIDGSGALEEKVSPTDAKRLLLQAIALIDKHCDTND